MQSSLNNVYAGMFWYADMSHVHEQCLRGVVWVDAGGRGVIEILEKDLRLTPKQAQPSKDALYRFGYTSSATTW